MSEAAETTLSLVSPASLDNVEARLNEFRAFVGRVLKHGVDYGTIPGTKKDTLLKPGAERILQLYGLTATVVTETAVEEFYRPVPFFHYRLRIVLTHRGSGEIVGEGVGSCNSMEKRYLSTEYWKDKKNPPPQGEGWEPFRGQYGAGFRRKMPNENAADLANTILKIAKKRALVDAALTVGAASEFFTQDMDDMIVEDRPHRGGSKPSKGAHIEEHEHSGEEVAGGSTAEQGTVNPKVEGSSPSRPANQKTVEVPRPTRDAELEMTLVESIAFLRLKKALADGFRSSQHKVNWLNKHKAELDALPEHVKAKLREAFFNAKVGNGRTDDGGGSTQDMGADAPTSHPHPHPQAHADHGAGEVETGQAGAGQGEGGSGPTP